VKYCVTNVGPCADIPLLPDPTVYKSRGIRRTASLTDSSNNTNVLSTHTLECNRWLPAHRDSHASSDGDGQKEREHPRPDSPARTDDQAASGRRVDSGDSEGRRGGAGKAVGAVKKEERSHSKASDGQSVRSAARGAERDGRGREGRGEGSRRSGASRAQSRAGLSSVGGQREADDLNPFDGK